jgi:serine/threonine protein kinase
MEAISAQSNRAPIKQEGNADKAPKLPSMVMQRYTSVRQKESTGTGYQEWIIKDKVSGEQVVLRLYSQQSPAIRQAQGKGVESLLPGPNYQIAGAPPDPKAMLLLRQSDTHYFQRVLEYHDDSDGTWEIRENCPLGTLEDYLSDSNGKFATATIEEIIREIYGILRYVHGLSLGMAIRNLTPKSIMVRSKKPLDLVLRDYGLPANQGFLGDNDLTLLLDKDYAAPEAMRGEGQQGSDWYSLGAMVFRFCTGTSLTQATAGAAVPYAADPNSRRHDLTLVHDAHWRALVDGLLADDIGKRWGANEVVAWFNNEYANPCAVQGRSDTTTANSATFLAPESGSTTPASQYAKPEQTGWFRRMIRRLIALFRGGEGRR